MVRINKKKSSSNQHRALLRQRKRNSEKILQGKTGVPKNNSKTQEAGKMERISHRFRPELIEYANPSVFWNGL